MFKLLMISGDRSLAVVKRGAFYNTLAEFSRYWERIDIICPHSQASIVSAGPFFGNVFVHPSPWSLWRQSQWIYKKGLEIYREQKFDLMTVHEYPPFYNGLGARMLWGKVQVPYLLEIHHIPGYPRSAGWKETLYRNLMKMFIKYDVDKAVAVRTVNQNQVPDFLKKAGIPSEKIKFIPSLYIDLETFRPIDLEKEYELIFVGRLVENKGLNLFLETVKKMAVKALIVGEGPLKEAAKLKIENWKLKIDLFGWAKDSMEVARLINKSRVLVMASYNEGGPRVVVEAMACGVPVLATPVGMVSDLIKTGQSGVIIDWRAEDIAEKAMNLLENRIKYHQYSRTGIEIARNFERKVTIKNYADKLQELI